MPRLLPALLIGGVFLGCGAEDRPPYAVGSSGVDRGKEDGGNYFKPPDQGPPGPDASGLCGNLIVPLVIERPNFYFVVDASGSMTESMGTGAVNGIIPNRYQAARLAMRDLLRLLGHRIQYGVALFPASSDTDGCLPGEEVFETREGDAVSFALSGETGPVLASMLRTLSIHTPQGATPTAASIAALKDRILAIPGGTYAFLLTDGAPNCNSLVACGADQCVPNIEGICGPTLNCCDPANQIADYRQCLDAEPTVTAVQELAAGGVPTFVIGMPGTATFASLLDRIADAGGTARPDSPRYYPVESTDELAGTLQQIGLDLTVECTVALEAPPPDPDLVNVYFDEVVLPRDPENGWTWDGENSISIVGPACSLLKGGEVVQLQVVAGCPTVIR